MAGQTCRPETYSEGLGAWREKTLLTPKEIVCEGAVESIFVGRRGMARHRRGRPDGLRAST